MTKRSKVMESATDETAEYGFDEVLPIGDGLAWGTKHIKSINGQFGQWQLATRYNEEE